MAVLAAAQSKREGEAKNAGNLNAAADAEEQAGDVWEDNAAVNKSIAETNLTNSIRTGIRAGMLNVQRAQARQQSIKAGIALGKDRLKAIGAAGANAAAAGSIGASVDAVVADINQEVESVDSELVRDYRLTNENLDNELMGILQAGDDAIQSAQTVNVRRPNRPRNINSNIAALGAGLISFAGNYASNNMSLGLGSTQSASAKYQDAVKRTGIY
jgi:hypothetical protein